MNKFRFNNSIILCWQIQSWFTALNHSIELKVLNSKIQAQQSTLGGVSKQKIIMKSGDTYGT